MAEECHSPDFTSPEFDKRDPNNDWFKFDIYSMGIIMLKLQFNKVQIVDVKEKKLELHTIA